MNRDNGFRELLGELVDTVWGDHSQGSEQG